MFIFSFLRKRQSAQKQEQFNFYTSTEGSNSSYRYALYDTKIIGKEEKFIKDNYAIYSDQFRFFENDPKRDISKDYLVYGVAIGISSNSDTDRAVIKENSSIMIKFGGRIVLTAPLIGIPDVYIYGKEYFWKNYLYDTKTPVVFLPITVRIIEGDEPIPIPLTGDVELTACITFDGALYISQPTKLSVIFDTIQRGENNEKKDK